ncbi:unnamed protein product [Calypogeia fissa]
MSMTLDVVDDGGRYRGVTDGQYRRRSFDGDYTIYIVDAAGLQVVVVRSTLAHTYSLLKLQLPAHPGGVHSGSVGPFVLLLVGGVGPEAHATSRAWAGAGQLVWEREYGAPRARGEQRGSGGGGMEQSPSSARGSVALVVALSFAFALSVGRSVALVQMLMMHTGSFSRFGRGWGGGTLVSGVVHYSNSALSVSGWLAGLLAVKQSATVILLGGGGTREEEVGTEHGARDGFNADFSILFRPAGWHTEFCDCPSTTGASSVRQIVVCTQVGVIQE